MEGVIVMTYHNFQRIVLSLLITCFLSACGTSAIYRPEVDEFNKAANAVHIFVKAKQSAVNSVRVNLRKDVLKEKRPMIKLNTACNDAIQNLASSKSPIKKAKNCKLKIIGDSELELLYSSEPAFENTVNFSKTIEAYSVALQNVATSGDKESFLQATSNLGDAVVSLAGTAAKIANKKAPEASRFAPISNLIGLGVFYILENKRSEALMKAAEAAHPWIVDGSNAIKKVLYRAEYEIMAAQQVALVEQIDLVNEAEPANYVAAADKAIKQLAELKTALKVDPGLTFQKFPDVHQKLLEAFKDKKRKLAHSIAASKDLFNAAKEARTALNTK